jgi:protein TonB
VEKPTAEKRIVKKEPAPPLKPKEIKKEIPKEPPKEEPPPKVQVPQPEPDFQPDKSEPTPDSPAAGAAQPSGKGAGETAKGTGKEEKEPGSHEGGVAFLEVSLNPGPRKEGIAGGGGEKQARVLGGEGGNSGSKPTGSSLSAVDPVLLQIMRRIEEAKRYPEAARRMGIEGKTVVRFKLKPGGQVEAVEVAESSGSDILDKASVETVREAAPLPYKEGWLKVGIVFKIL